MGTYKSLSTIIRGTLDNRFNSELILEEAKKKDSGIVVLQHNKLTGDMSFVRIHPKSKNHVVYSSLAGGKQSEAIFHKDHIEHMLGLFKSKDDK